MTSKKNETNELSAAAERAVSDLRAAEAAYEAIDGSGRPERLDKPNCSSAPMVARRPDGTTVYGLEANALLVSYEVAITKASDERSYRYDRARFALDAADMAQGDEVAVACNLVVLHRDLLAIDEERERLRGQRQLEPDSITRSRLSIRISELDVREEERIAQARSAHPKRCAEREAANLPAPPPIPGPQIHWTGLRSVREVLTSNPPSTRPPERAQYISPGLGSLLQREQDVLAAIDEEAKKARKRAIAEAAHVPAAERQRLADVASKARWEAKLASDRAEQEARAAAGGARVAAGDVPGSDAPIPSANGWRQV